jgi:5-methylcytosine-specific restriction endonuclease McrA
MASPKQLVLVRDSASSSSYNRGEMAERFWSVSAARTRARKWNAPGRGLTPTEWRAILADFGHRCAYCLADGKMVLEHIEPLARGGAHDPDNVVPACAPCNRSKHRHSVLRFYLNRRADQMGLAA